MIWSFAVADTNSCSYNQKCCTSVCHYISEIGREFYMCFDPWSPSENHLLVWSLTFIYKYIIIIRLVQSAAGHELCVGAVSAAFWIESPLALLRNASRHLPTRRCSLLTNSILPHFNILFMCESAKLSHSAWLMLSIIRQCNNGDAPGSFGLQSRTH